MRNPSSPFPPPLFQNSALPDAIAVNLRDGHAEAQTEIHRRIRWRPAGNTREYCDELFGGVLHLRSHSRWIQARLAEFQRAGPLQAFIDSSLSYAES